MKKERKERVDKLLYERGLVDSREKAKALVMAGCVFKEQVRIEKPGQLLDKDTHLTIRKALPYVSRGGLKLEKAIREFGVMVEGKVVMDVGASTGGFTDCLLQHGARKVYAIDVGYGQMDLKIAHDPRVIRLDQVNIRSILPQEFKEPFDLITIDVSFISLRLVLPVVKRLLANNGAIIALVKPEFEVGKGQVGKGGVVRDPEKHGYVLQQLIQFAQEIDLYLAGLTISPITGAKGNREFFLYLFQEGEKLSIDTIEQIIKKYLSQA